MGVSLSMILLCTPINGFYSSVGHKKLYLSQKNPLLVTSPPSTPPRGGLLKKVLTKQVLGNFDISNSDKSSQIDYSALTVPKLKEMLRERGLPVSGVKAVLIGRLEESDVTSAPPKDDINNLADLDAFYDALDDDNTPLLSPSDSVKVDGDVPKVYDNRPDWCARGDKLLAKINRYGPLGANVDVRLQSDPEGAAPRGQGLILQDELNYYALLKGSEPLQGQEVPAFVLSVRTDGKINVSLRPVGYDKVRSARDQVLKALEAEGAQGHLPVGDKSSPALIWETFPGLSKGQFKAAVGALLREGAITIAEDSMVLVPEANRLPMPAQPYSGKSPQGFKVSPDGATLFVGNLDYSLDEMSLARAIEEEIGVGHMARVKVATGDNGGSRGYAHIDFFSPEQATMALGKLQGVTVRGRGLRLERKVSSGMRSEKAGGTGRSGRFAYDESSSSSVDAVDWGSSSSRGIRRPDGSYARQEADMLVATVYIGNLPYSADERYIAEALEDRLVALGAPSDRRNIVEVRCAVERDTGRKRGFGYADVRDEATAKMMCEQCNGLVVMGRALRLDYEGLKRGATEGPGSRSGGGGGGGGGRRREGGGRGGRGGSGSFSSPYGSRAASEGKVSTGDLQRMRRASRSSDKGGSRRVPPDQRPPGW